MEFTDQLHRKIEIPETPKRIVSLVPSQTELLVDLGLKSALVGITKFCVHPKTLRKEKKVVGGTKTIHLEKIKALKPDLILCNKEENTEEMVANLEKIAPVHVSDIVTLEDAFELMRQYGNLFGKNLEAEKLIAEIEKKKEVLVKKLQGRQAERTAYFIWKKPLILAGTNTFINTLLKLNKLDNIVEGRYPEINLEKLEELQPEVILLSSEPFPFKEKHKQIFDSLKAEVILVDGEYFSWYGSRLVKAMDYFAGLQDHASISR
ncbi:ABC transporter substrate-binding protein [Zunongwangia sp. H14]|uniref:ABC transporter substrate-binding protein n=1 Tax=Zunongwangia sp. H14 TaxID=3240792 RepID=UPI003566B7C7